MKEPPMTDIVTLTLNPAVDISFSVGQLVPTHKMRCEAVRRDPGGGGINVARVIQRLGGDCVALYLAGGRTGRALGALLAGEQLRGDPVPIIGETRENVTAFERASGREYRFVMPGPEISPLECEHALGRLDAFVPAPRYLVASGSLAPGIAVDIYARLARRARARGSRFVLDASGDALAAALEEGVYLVKPSLGELRMLTGQSLDDESQWSAAASDLVDRGRASIVALTLGEQGALIATASGVLRSPALPVPVVSAVGAGDSFLGGLVWALERGSDLETALRYGVAAGAAAVTRAGTMLAAPADIVQFVGKVEVGAAVR